MRTQIVINNTQVDLLKEVNLNITKQLVDIQNPEKRKADRSLTIEIPGSKANDLLFSYIFEVNIDLDADDSTQQAPHFNPNKKADVIIFIDSLRQLKGYCQLTDVLVTQRDTIIYKIVCYGEVGDLFGKIGNSKLEDLDFSEFDHSYIRGNIANSWDTEIIENGSGIAFEVGKGYLYPMIDYGAERTTFEDGGVTGELWDAGEFRPAIYVKQYIDKIFEAAGYTYTSNFFNTDFFKRLFIPFNSDKFILDQDEVDTRLFHAARSASIYSSSFYNTPSNIASAAPIVFNDEANPYFDNNNNYDATTGKYVCNKAARYSFITKITAKLDYNDGTNKLVVFGTNKVRVFFSLIHKSGSSYKNVGSAWADANFSGTEINSGDLSNEFHLTLVANDIKMEVGDEFFVAASHILAIINSGLSTGNVQTGWTVKTQATAESYFANGMPAPYIQEGDDLLMNQCIPKDIKQRDLVAAIIKAFNLYIEPNFDIENDLLIEPRADYYTGQYTDWTEKLDLSKDFTISPMGALDAGEYHFKYADDADYNNAEYKNLFDRTYGDYKLKIDNDFVKKTKKIELLFAPTPLYKKPGSSTNRILSAIHFFDKSGKVSPKTSKIRLLYYGGMKNCDAWYLDAYNFVPYRFTQYPYSGHLDDPYDSSIDLGFAPPFEVFYRTTANLPIQYINQNLFTKYWYSQITEFTDKNSKLVEGWFYLTPSDIEGLSFRKYYFIKDAYYRLLKIENYDPVFSKVTKCQFLKVQEFDAPLQVKTRLNGGRGTFGTSGTIYDVPTIAGTNAPVGSPTSGPRVNTGWGNTTDNTATGVVLTGTNNTVLSGGTGVTVLGGDGNTIYAGLQNVTLINTSDITVTESNVLYINNQKYTTVIMGDSITITNGDSPYTLTNATRTLFCDTTEGSISVNLPTAANNNGKIFEVIKTDATVNGITVNADGSETINGAASAGLTTQYEVLKIVSNGSNWYKL
jgi:hypothetical protein